MIDAATVAACLREDPRAHRAFYEATAPYVYAVVSGYVADAEHRKDAMQEAYATLFDRLDRYDPARGELKPWLRRVVVNECLQYLRRRSALHTDLPAGERFAALPVRDREPSAQEQLQHAELLDALVGMPEGYRLPFRLVAVEGYSHAEAAELLGIGAETSRSQLTRARRWLRRRLAPSRRDSSLRLESQRV